jgi:preprotein translocase subunit SecE
MAAPSTESKKKETSYLRGVKSELKKVIWPTKKDMTKYTTVVIVTCIFAMTGIWVLDTLFRAGLKFFM